MIIEDDKVISTSIIRVKRNPILTSNIVYKDALDKVDLKFDDVNFCVGTGYGREKIPFINKSLSEITCHGRGAYYLNQKVRTIIDIGGQDCKIIKLDNEGDLKDFRMNEKCAAGTGRYLEIMADLLGLSLDELGQISKNSRSSIQLSSACSIYAQSEVMKLVSKKVKKKDIVYAINKSMADRVFLMTKNLILEPAFAISGGVAKNETVVMELEFLIKKKFVNLNFDSQLIGALGASIIARENLKI